MRLEGITWGAEDFQPLLAATTIGWTGPMTTSIAWRDRSVCWPSRQHRPPIDTVYTDFWDEKGLVAECAAARRSGFTAKMAIHPAQVPVINRFFSATEEELVWARKVVDVSAQNPDAGTLALDGKMVDKPHLTLAHRLIGLGSA